MVVKVEDDSPWNISLPHLSVWIVGGPTSASGSLPAPPERFVAHDVFTGVEGVWRWRADDILQSAGLVGVADEVAGLLRPGSAVEPAAPGQRRVQLRQGPGTVVLQPHALGPLLTRAGGGGGHVNSSAWLPLLSIQRRAGT